MTRPDNQAVACPLCEGQAPKQWLARAALVAGTDHDLVACESCGLIFMDPMPDRRVLQSFYAADYFSEFDRTKLEGRGRAFARRYLRHLPSRRFLDVGCAIGAFLHGVQQASGWDVHGVDIGESAIRYARDTFKLDAQSLQLPEAGFPDAFFDFIHVNNVMEHTTDPVRLMKECRRILKPTGHMYLSVPNGANDSRNLVRFWREEHAAGCSKDGHLFFFPPRALQALFQRSGFVVRQSHSYGFNRGLRNCGLLPQKKHWKSTYTPRPLNVRHTSDGAVSVRESHRYPEWYYRYRLWKTGWGIPGLHAVGLDFRFILGPD